MVSEFFGGVLRFKVPQNIDMQDRILGPLTMVQFVYAVVGFGFCYIIYNAIPKPFSIVLILPIVIFVICLDFIKVNERPFLDFLISMIAFITAPKQRVWHQGDDSDLSIEIYQNKSTTEPVIHHKEISRAQIEDVARKIDQSQSPLIKN